MSFHWTKLVDQSLTKKLKLFTVPCALAFALAGFAQSQTLDPLDSRIGSIIQQIDKYVDQGMKTTGVPGVAVGIVYRDKVVYARGFGLREAGKTAAVNQDTVFQLASLSKAVTSTVVASLVGTRDVSWDSHITDLDTEFSLSDPAVTAQLTIRDLFCHRSGLATSSGDALEDLGFARPEILRQMRLLPLPNQFRKDYKYSNFGYTEGAIAAAKAVDEQWENLADQRLFKPLRMDSTSYRFSDYQASLNRASIHIIENGKPIARYLRRPDAEAPAGGASSSIRDLSKWLRLQLADGRFNGRTVVDATALQETHTPQIPNGANQSYALGWNVNYDLAGNPVLGHSGAFFIGVGTCVRMSPSAQVGIIVLTNAQPTGLAEATALTFFDLVEQGKPSRDWLPPLIDYFKKTIADSNNETLDYSTLPLPPNAAPGNALSSYTGTYSNNYYGAIEITAQAGMLWMRFPRNGALYSLTHWDGDQFTYRFEAEQGVGTRGVKFTLGGTAQVRIDNLAVEGDGVFLRTSN